MTGEGGPQPRVLEPYDMSTPHQHGRQQTNPFWSDRGRAPDVASRSERPRPPSEEVKRSPTSQELEAIRERILREAHLNFEKEVKKLTGGGGSSTFESANSVGERAKLRGSTDALIADQHISATRTRSRASRRSATSAQWQLRSWSQGR